MVRNRNSIKRLRKETKQGNEEVIEILREKHAEEQQEQ